MPQSSYGERLAETGREAGRTARQLGSQHVKIWAAGLVLVLALGGFYLYQFQASREHVLTARYLRSLSIVARDLQERVQHFRHILHAYESGRPTFERLVRVEDELTRVDENLARVDKARERVGDALAHVDDELTSVRGELESRHDTPRDGAGLAPIAVSSNGTSDKIRREAARLELERQHLELDGQRLELEASRLQEQRARLVDASERERRRLGTVKEAGTKGGDRLAELQRIRGLERLTLSRPDTSEDVNKEPGERLMVACPSNSRRRPLRVRLDDRGVETMLQIEYLGCSNPLALRDPVAPVMPVRARLPLADVVAASTMPGPFAQLLVANHAGAIVYASEAGQIRFANVRELRIEGASRVEGQAEPTTLRVADLAAQSQVERVTIAGSSYRLFSHPLALAPGSKQWVLIGLAPAAAFDAGILTVNLNWLAISLLGFILIILAWPYLKLHHLRPSERVRQSDYVYLGMSALIGTAFLALAFWDTVAYMSVRSKLDDVAQQAARQIAETFRREVQWSRDELRTYTHTTVRCRNGSGGAGIDDERPCGPVQPFEIAFWLDADGNAVGRPVNFRARTVGDVRVPERTYFRRAAAGAVWQIPDDSVDDPKRVPASAPAPCTLGSGIFIERIRVRDEGTKLTAISAPVHCGAGDTWEARVAVTVKRMQATFAPILPPSYAFAIIDETGRVHYHSDDSRSLVENLFEVTDTGRRLEAAVSARAVATFAGTYHGDEYRLSVHPITNVPWSVVILRDTSLLATANFDLVVSCGLILLGYALLYLVTAIVLGRSVPGFRGAWFWPLPRPRADYEGIPRALGALAAFYVAAILSLESWGHVSMLVTIPPLTISFLFITLYPRIDSQPWSHWLGAGIFCASVLALVAELATWLRDHRFAWVALVLALLAMRAAYAARQERTRRLPDLADTAPRRPRPGTPLTVSRDSLRYAGVVFLTFTLLAWLPATSIFFDGVERYRDGLTKLAQLRLARAFDRRAAALHDDEARVRGRRTSRRTLAGLERGSIYGWHGLFEYCRWKTGSDEGTCHQFLPWLVAPTRLGEPPPTNGDGHESDRQGWSLNAWLEDALPIFNKNVLPWRQIANECADGSTTWSAFESPDANGGSAPGLEMRYRHGTFEVRSALFWPAWPDARGWIAIVLMAIACLLYAVVIVTSLGRRLFGSEIATPRPPDGDALAEEWTVKSRFVVRPSEEFRRSLEERLAQAPYSVHRNPGGAAASPLRGRLREAWRARRDAAHRVVWLNLAQLGPETRAPDWLPGWAAEAPIVIVEGAEARFDDPSATREVLRFLRRLVERGRVVHVLATVEPRRWLQCLQPETGGAVDDGNPAPHAAETADWERFLARFVLMRPPQPSRLDEWKHVANRSLAILKRECAWHAALRDVERDLEVQPRFTRDELTEEQVVELVRERATSVLQRFWRFSTREEKLALYQLADDAMVNPKNTDVVAGLMQRGAIIRDPDFMLASKSLAQFIRHAEPAERFARWEEQASAESAWRFWRVPILVLILALGGGILYSQADTLESTVTVLTGVLAGLPMLVKLSSLLLRTGRIVPVSVE